MAMPKVELSPSLIPLPDAARELELQWHQAWRLVLLGTLVAERRGSRWYVHRSSLGDVLQQLQPAELKRRTE